MTAAAAIFPIGNDALIAAERKAPAREPTS